MFNKENNKRSPITDLSAVYGLFESFILTKCGSLIGGIELTGCESEGFLKPDFLEQTKVLSNIYEKLPNNITLTQYYIHHNGINITLKERKHPISDLLSQNRQSYLNDRNLTQSKIVYFFEILPDERLQDLSFFDLLKHLTAAPFQSKSRLLLKNHFSEQKMLIVQQEALCAQSKLLQNLLSETVQKLQSITDADMLSPQDLWRYTKFLATLDSDYLTETKPILFPEENWDSCLSHGNIDQVSVDYTEMLKIHDAKSRYARVASLTHFDQAVHAGLWAFNHDDSFTQFKGNFVILVRWKPLSTFERAMFFKKKALALERASLNLLDMITGRDKTELEKKALMKPSLTRKQHELQESEDSPFKFGLVHILIATFGEVPQAVIQNAQEINKIAQQSLVHVIWESAYLQEAFKTMQLGQGQHYLRDMLFNTPQMGAVSVINKSQTGKNTAVHIENEEAQFIFENADGSPFFFNPYVGGKSVMIGVGPIGSGKSFFKNVLGAHFLKYGGLLHAIDIDAGTEPLADLFCKDGGIFRMSDDQQQGFNPFVSARTNAGHYFLTRRNEKDERKEGTKEEQKEKINFQLIRHLKSLLIQMIETNDQIELRTLNQDDQKNLDDAIMSVLALPKNLQRLSTLISHMPQDLAVKFQRFIHATNTHVQDGLYAYLFDAQTDAIEKIGESNEEKRIAVFNLKSLRKDIQALSLVMKEIFYRITTVFEDPKYLNIPKQLDIDEAHHFLKIKDNVQFLLESVRTWRKYRAGITLWSQGAPEFLSIPDWSVVRDAAGTFIFMATPKMDEELYQKTFGLTLGECKAIQQLIPRREVYIIQPDLKISKKVQLNVDPMQYALITSNPNEVALRSKLINQYGFKKGIQRMIEQLNNTHKT